MRTNDCVLVGSSQTWLFQTWLVFPSFTQMRCFALFCALLSSFALFCGLAFAIICTYLRSSFACFCVRPRLERLRLGTPEAVGKYDCGQRLASDSVLTMARFRPSKVVADLLILHQFLHPEETTDLVCSKPSLKLVKE